MYTVSTRIEEAQARLHPPTPDVDSVIIKIFHHNNDIYFGIRFGLVNANISFLMLKIRMGRIFGQKCVFVIPNLSLIYVFIS